jgi:hypothetical protein
VFAGSGTYVRVDDLSTDFVHGVGGSQRVRVSAGGAFLNLSASGALRAAGVGWGPRSVRLLGTWSIPVAWTGVECSRGSGCECESTVRVSGQASEYGVRFHAGPLQLPGQLWRQMRNECAAHGVWERLTSSILVTVGATSWPVSADEMCAARQSPDSSVWLSLTQSGGSALWERGGSQLYFCVDGVWHQRAQFLILYALLFGFLLTVLDRRDIVVPLVAGGHYWASSARQLFQQSQLLVLCLLSVCARWGACSGGGWSLVVAEGAVIAVAFVCVARQAAFVRDSVWQGAFPGVRVCGVSVLGAGGVAGGALAQFRWCVARRFLVPQSVKLAVTFLSRGCLPDTWYHATQVVLVFGSTSSWVSCMVDVALVGARAREHDRLRVLLQGGVGSGVVSVGGAFEGACVAVLCATAFWDGELYFRPLSLSFFPSHGRVFSLMVYMMVVFGSTRKWLWRVRRTRDVVLGLSAESSAVAVAFQRPVARRDS